MSLGEVFFIFFPWGLILLNLLLSFVKQDQRSLWSRSHLAPKWANILLNSLPDTSHITIFRLRLVRTPIISVPLKPGDFSACFFQVIRPLASGSFLMWMFWYSNEDSVEGGGVGASADLQTFLSLQLSLLLYSALWTPYPDVPKFPSPSLQLRYTAGLTLTFTTLCSGLKTLSRYYTEWS